MYLINLLCADPVLVRETWLDDSIEEVDLPGYTCISRRDRSDAANRGGIATFCKNDIKNLVFLKHSEAAERSWHLILRDSGTLALCNWYRPPHAETHSIETFKSEMESLAEDVVGNIVTGDLNVHHVRWLRYSNGNMRGGRSSLEYLSREQIESVS